MFLCYAKIWISIGIYVVDFFVLMIDRENTCDWVGGWWWWGGGGVRL